MKLPPENSDWNAAAQKPSMDVAGDYPDMITQIQGGKNQPKFDFSKVQLPEKNEPKFDFSKVVVPKTEESVAPSEEPQDYRIPQKGESFPGYLARTASSELGSVVNNLKAGMAEPYLGTLDLLHQLGVGAVPTYKNGKIQLQALDPEVLAGAEQEREKLESGGVSGFIERGGANPLNYLPTGKLGLGLSGALQGGIASALAPTTDPTQTLGGRAAGAATGTLLGGAAGKVLQAGSAVASKIAPSLATKSGISDVKEVTPTTDPVSTLRWIGNFLAGNANPPRTTKEMASLLNAAQKAGLDIQGKEPKQIFDEIKNWYDTNVGNIMEKVSPGTSKTSVNELNYNFAINKYWDATRKKISNMYNNVRAMGQNEPAIPAENIEPLLGKVIKDLEQKMAGTTYSNEEAMALQKLRPVYELVKQEEEKAPIKSVITDQYGRFIEKEAPPEPPKTIPTNKAVEILQAVNHYYTHAPEMGAEDVPFVKLRDIVNNELKTHTSPRFQKALATANKANGEKERIFGNKAIQQFWSPEDHSAWRNLMSGHAANISVDTRKRMEGLLNKIKSPADLEALRESLPREDYNALSAYKFGQVMQDAGLDIGKLADENTYKTVVKTLQDKGHPEIIPMVDAMKTVVEGMNERGVGNLNPAALEKSNKIIDRAARTAWSFTLGKKMYGFKHGYEVLKNLLQQQPVNEIQRNVVDYAKDLRRAAPVKQYTPGIVPQTLIRPIGTDIGQQTQNQPQ